MTSIATVLVTVSGAVPFANEEFDPNIVTPGVGGFLVIALLACGVTALGFDLVRRLRRGKYREEIRLSLAEEVAARDAAAGETAAEGQTDRNG